MHQSDDYESVFTSTEAFSHHRTLHSKDFLKRFKCNLCPYSTNIKSNIKTHSFVHSGERPYKCKVCDKGFTQSQSLKRHMLLHTGEKPFLCNVCNMSFRQAESLKVHMHKHI